MITQNIPTHLGAGTLVYLISKRAKYAMLLIVIMIIISSCVLYWSQNIAGFFTSHSFVFHYLAVVLYAVVKYGWIIALLLFFWFAISALVEYKNTLFTLSDSAFSVSSGTVTRNEITIPYSHIETINLSNSPSLRMFGLCSFVVKTSAQNGAGVSSAQAEPDAILPAISMSLAKEIQNHILSISNPPIVVPPVASPVVSSEVPPVSGV